MEVTTSLYIYPALSGANACSKVYPGVTHILCRWHVDRYIILVVVTKVCLAVTTNVSKLQLYKIPTD